MIEKLSTLEARLNNYKSIRGQLKGEIGEKQKLLSKHDVSIKNIEDQIKKALVLNVNKSIVITDHAVLRYVERVLCVNIDDIKNTIITEESEALIRSFNGNGGFPISNKIGVVKNYKVITIK